MAKCVICGAETQLFISNVPICVKCEEEQEQKRLKEEEQQHGDEPQRDPKRP